MARYITKRVLRSLITMFIIITILFALLRLMLPQADITGGQPGEDMRNGFSDRQGNLNALAAGANVLFADLLPAPLADDFRVTDHRAVQGLAHLQEMAALSGMQLRLD